MLSTFVRSISLLLDALQKTEYLRRKANGSHMEAIDRSLKTHETRLNAIDKFFHQNIKTSDKNREYKNIINFRNEGENTLLKINLRVNHRNENRFITARSNAISKTPWTLPYFYTNNYTFLKV